MEIGWFGFDLKNACFLGYIWRNWSTVLAFEVMGIREGNGEAR